MLFSNMCNSTTPTYNSRCTLRIDLTTQKCLDLLAPYDLSLVYCDIRYAPTGQPINRYSEFLSAALVP